VTGVKQYLLDTVLQCRKKGYVETLFGRRRYLTTICSSNAAVRGTLTLIKLHFAVYSYISVTYLNLLKRFNFHWNCTCSNFAASSSVKLNGFFLCA